MLWSELSRIGEQYDPLEQVLELPNVARPGLCRQPGVAVGGNRDLGQLVALAHLAKVMKRDKRKVGAPQSQRRHQASDEV